MSLFDTPDPPPPPEPPKSPSMLQARLIGQSKLKIGEFPGASYRGLIKTSPVGIPNISSVSNPSVR